MVTGRPRQRSWETPEGDKRSITEIEADEVGASLKWPRLRSNGPASAATATAAPVGSGRPNAAATSTTRHPSEHSSRYQRPRPEPGALAYGQQNTF